MMKRKLIIITTVVLAFFMADCTHNNGDIGPYFGTWKLLDIEADGSTVPEYEGDIFWQFQSDVFCMREVLPNHDTDVRWGSWEEIDGNILILNFSHYDDSHEPGSTMYSPISVTGLEATVNRLEIVSLSGSKMTLIYQSPDGTEYCYRLKKW